MATNPSPTMHKKAEIIIRESDEILVEKYLENEDNRLFGLLYKRYSGKVFAKCLSMLGDHQKAEDAVQDIFIKVVLKLSSFNRGLLFFDLVIQYKL